MQNPSQCPRGLGVGLNLDAGRPLRHRGSVLLALHFLSPFKSSAPTPMSLQRTCFVLSRMDDDDCSNTYCQICDMQRNKRTLHTHARFGGKQMADVQRSPPLSKKNPLKFSPAAHSLLVPVCPCHCCLREKRIANRNSRLRRIINITAPLAEISP